MRYQLLVCVTAAHQLVHLLGRLLIRSLYPLSILLHHFAMRDMGSHSTSGADYGGNEAPTEPFRREHLIITPASMLAIVYHTVDTISIGLRFPHRTVGII